MAPHRSAIFMNNCTITTHSAVAVAGQTLFPLDCSRNLVFQTNRTHDKSSQNIITQNATTNIRKFSMLAVAVTTKSVVRTW